MSRALRLVVPAAALTAALAVPAVAQAPAFTLSLKPSKPGKATRLTLTANGGDGSALAGRSPKDLTVDVQRGAKLDPRAVAARCTLDRAEQAACPDGSKIGNGTAVLTVTSILGTMDYTATLRADLGAPVQKGDVASVLLGFSEPQTGTKGAAQGRVVKVAAGTFGLRLAFQDVGGSGALPAGVTAQLKSLTLGVSTSRKVSGKKVSLLTTPPKCVRGSFVAQATLTFTSGDPVVQPLSTKCG